MRYLNVSVATLTRRHPWAREVLEWHGIDLDTVDSSLSLSALCWLKRIDAARITTDLMAANPDDADEELFRFLHDGDTVVWQDDELEDWDDEAEQPPVFAAVG